MEETITATINLSPEELSIKSLLHNFVDGLEKISSEDEPKTLLDLMGVFVEVENLAKDFQNKVRDSIKFIEEMEVSSTVSENDEVEEENTDDGDGKYE